MPFFIFLIIYLILRKSTPKDRRGSDFFKWFIGIYIAMAVISNIIPVLTGFSGIALIIGIILWLSRKKQQKNREDENTRQQQFNDMHGYDESEDPYRQPGQSAAHRTSTYSSARYSDSSAQYNPNTSGKRPSPTAYTSPRPESSSVYTSTPTQTKSKILPRRQNRRLKILKNFNNKFDLNLTEEQMQSIVNSSYMSETWKRELESMTVHYDSVYEWFQGETRYLRAYLYAFRVQEITSDIYQQEQICMHAFEQVWNYADSLSSLSLEERIQRVNDTYYTQFDNITFMIAYRFLEARGRKHKLDTLDPVQSGDDMEDLKKKYDTMFGEDDILPEGQKASH